MSIETRLRETGPRGGGGGGGSSDSSGLAGTGGLYVVYSNQALLPFSKVLSAGANITLTTDATSILVSASTGGGGGGTINPGSAGFISYYPSGSNGTTLSPSLLSTSTGSGIAPLNFQALTSELASPVLGDFWTLNSSGLGVFLKQYISNTAFYVQLSHTNGTVNSAGLAGTGMYYIVGSAAPTLPFSKIITAGSSITTHTDSTSFYINATTGASTSVQEPTFPGNIPLSSMVYKQFRSDGLIASDTTQVVQYNLYSPPNGKRTLFMGYSVFNNTTSITIGSVMMLVSNSISYGISGGGNTNPKAIGNNNNTGLIIDSGETLAIQLSAVASTVSIYMKLIEIDTSVNVRGVKLYSPNSGNNTFFTSSQTSSTVLLDTVMANLMGGARPQFVNFTSSAILAHLYLVPSGQLPNDKYLISTPTGSTASRSTTQFQFNCCMQSGSYLSFYVNSSGLRNILFVNIMEV